MNSIKKYFEIEERGSNFKKEIIGGIIIFLAMFYIVAVQGYMVGDAIAKTGGPDNAVAGVMIVTAITAGLTSIFMGTYAKHPVALASGMGVNAYIAYSLIFGGMPWEAALSAVLMSGIIFIIISATPARGKIINAIPDDIKKAISIGVGLFLMFVALVNGGIINPNPGGTPVELGKFIDPFVILSLISIFTIIILWILKVEGAVLIGMIVTLVLGLVFSYSGWKTDLTYADSFLPGYQGFAMGDYGASFVAVGELFGKSISSLWNKADATWANPTWYLAIFILFINDFFDTTGTLMGVNQNLEVQGVVPEEKYMKRALIVDALGTTVGSVFGSTNVTSFAETNAGVVYGARTGLAPVVVGILFLATIPVIPFLQPLLTPSVTCGAIVLIGVMMASQLKGLNYDDPVVTTASIFTIMFMIFSYSIGTGIVMGLLTYVLLMVVTGKFKEVDWMLYVLSPILLIFLLV